jgi:hypothetical protein
VLKWRSKRDVDAGVAFSRNKKIRYDNGKDPPWKIWSASLSPWLPALIFRQNSPS